MKKIIEIKYNSQRDNDSWGGKLQPWVQCFYTTCIMLLSRYIPDFEKREKETEYVDDIEVFVGKPGLGEQIIAKEHLSGRSGQYWVVQQAGIMKYMALSGRKGKCIFSAAMPIAEVVDSIDAGNPVAVGTDFGQGHVMLICGHDELGLFCEDPFGKGPDYKDTNGHQVHYAWDVVKKFFYSVTGHEGNVLAMRWQPE